MGCQNILVTGTVMTIITKKVATLMKAIVVEQMSKKTSVIHANVWKILQVPLFLTAWHKLP